MSVSEVIAVDDAWLRAWPLPTVNGGDKEERGRVLLVAGSPEIPGAAVLAATAAFRAGAGKVAIATPESIAQPIAFAVPEARVIALKGDGSDAADAALEALEVLGDKVQAVLIGPGLLEGRAICNLTVAILERYAKVEIIVDAGAMAVCKPDYHAMRFSTPVLLTPHAGEMAGLTGADKDEVADDPVRAALDAARKWNALVALKGAVTYIAAPDGRVWRHEGGNAGLATSGSGDVLAGIIAGLVARGTPLDQAAAWGVALHARAGVKLAERLGGIGYLARELPGEVPGLMDALSAR
jgi:hydroxyethylthiazole kinase-like uncharacterized protein yjeF